MSRSTHRVQAARRTGNTGARTAEPTAVSAWPPSDAAATTPFEGWQSGNTPQGADFSSPRSLGSEHSTEPQCLATKIFMRRGLDFCPTPTDNFEHSPGMATSLTEMVCRQAPMGNQTRLHRPRLSLGSDSWRTSGVPAHVLTAPMIALVAIERIEGLLRRTPGNVMSAVPL